MTYISFAIGTLMGILTDLKREVVYALSIVGLIVSVVLQILGVIHITVTADLIFRKVLPFCVGFVAGYMYSIWIDGEKFKFWVRRKFVRWKLRKSSDSSLPESDSCKKERNPWIL